MSAVTTVSTAGFSRKYDPHTHAVKMAAQDIQAIVDTFAKDHDAAPFMGQKRSPARQKVHREIMADPVALEMVRRGYPMYLAHEVAKINQAQTGHGADGADGADGAGGGR